MEIFKNEITKTNEGINEFLNFLNKSQNQMMNKLRMKSEKKKLNNEWMSKCKKKKGQVMKGMNEWRNKWVNNLDGTMYI